MAKKKKANDVNQYEGMVYKPEVSASYVDKWTPGEFVYDREAKRERYTGKLQSELVGYTIEMVGYIDGQKFGIIQSLSDEPMGRKECIEHFNTYQAHDYQPGKTWAPFTSRYPVGEIVDYELQ